MNKLDELAKQAGISKISEEQPEEKSLLRKAGDLFTSSTQKFGSTLGTAASVIDPYTKKMREETLASQQSQSDNYMKIAKETKDKEKAKMFLEAAAESAKTEGVDIFNNPEYQKTAKQILGEGAGTALEILSFGTFGKASQAGSKLPTVLQPLKPLANIKKGIIEGAKTGATYGGVFGTGFGVSGAMQENKSLGEIAGQGLKEGAIGTIGGGLLGGAVGGVSTGISEGTKFGVSKGKELASDLMSKYKNRPIAEVDRIIKSDNILSEASKQGLDKAKIIPIKQASNADKIKMSEMLNLGIKAKDNASVMQRPIDIVGKSILEPIKTMDNSFKILVNNLDDVASNLKGKDVKGLDSIFQSTNDDISRIGAQITPDGIDFSGSQFEDIGGVEKIINNVYKRLSKLKTADELHNLKRYIDNNVEYGKSTEGLTGQAENMLKGWRRNIDNLLDSQFKEYKTINDKLTKIFKQMDELHSVLGKKFNVNKPFAEIKAGQIASKVLTKSSNRGEVLSVLNNLFKISREFGYKKDEDIILQIIFADLLEDVLGTQATQGFQGQIKKAVGSELLKTLKSGHVGVGELAVKIGAEGYEKLVGITPEKQISSLRKLISIGKGGLLPSNK